MSGELRWDSREDLADAGAFLSRLVRLDPVGLVRVRDVTTSAADSLELWAWLPLDVLGTRRVGASWHGLAAEPADAVFRAADLLAALGPVTRLPESADEHWRGALPGTSAWRRLDAVPAAEVRRIILAGEQTFRAASAGAPNPTRVGTALLDHEVLVVSDRTESLGVPLRVVQALARMGFLGAVEQEGAVVVSVTAAWARFDAAYGSVYWRRRTPFSLTPV